VKTWFLMWVSVLLIAVPTTAQEVFVDYDRAATGTDYTSFDWAPTPETSLEDVDPQLHSQVKNAIEYYLTRGSLAQDDIKPQLLVTYHTGASLYGPLAETANLLGYSIYGIDMPGFMQTGGSDASLAQSRGPAYGSLAFFMEDDLHSSLRFMSAETGGLPLINDRRVSALGEVRKDIESFYWLGFTPQWQRNDERHSIRVEVNRPDTWVRTRSGYLDLASQTQVAMAVESSLLFGMGRPSAELQMKLGEVESVGSGLFNVDIEMSIPIGALTVEKSDTGYDAEAVLFVAALDASGGRSEVPAVPLLLSSPSPFPTKGLVAHSVTLKLRKNTERVSMALYDVKGGRTFTNTITKEEEQKKK